MTTLRAAMVSLGLRIRERREALGLTRPGLADRIVGLGYRIRAQQIYRWEQAGAEMHSSAVPFVERALDVAPGWLGHGDKVQAPPLAPARVFALIASLGLDPAERATVQAHLESQEAANEVVTESYLRGLITGLRLKLSPGEAFATAVNAQAQEGLKREGRTVRKRRRSRP